MTSRAAQTPRTVTAAYVSVTGALTLAASLIWGIGTIFLMEVGGLDIFEVTLVNAVIPLSQLIFEVPTGVLADTLGRRFSVLLCIGVLLVSTLLYWVTPLVGLGIGGFMLASAGLGLGWAFHTGALDAWFVDALDAAGHEGHKERHFASGRLSSGAGMLIGSLAGGLLGQVDLAWPFVARGALLCVAFAITFALVHDAGFSKRRLRLRELGLETRRVLRAGIRHGWQSPVIRPMLWVSGVAGLFYMYGNFAWQPYLLELLGHRSIWLLGAVQAGFSAAGMIGNAIVGRVMRTDGKRRDPAHVLVVLAACDFVVAVGIALVGLLAGAAGVVPAAVAIVLWLTWGFIIGLYDPVRMTYLNAHIPSRERATVLSFGALFEDVGGAVGQPALGWVSRRSSIAVAWLIGSAALAVAPSLYARSGRAAAEARASRASVA